MEHGQNTEITERKLVLYALRLWGVFFIVEAIYLISRPLVTLLWAWMRGLVLPENWTWFWVLEQCARPIFEGLAGCYLFWGGAWAASLIVRNMSSIDAQDPAQRLPE